MYTFIILSNVLCCVVLQFDSVVCNPTTPLTVVAPHTTQQLSTEIISCCVVWSHQYWSHLVSTWIGQKEAFLAKNANK